MKTFNSIKMCSNENKSRSFSIATFNVHMWVDGSHVDNFDRVKCLIKVSEFSLSAKSILLFNIWKCNKFNLISSNIENRSMTQTLFVCKSRLVQGKHIFPRTWIIFINIILQEEVALSIVKLQSNLCKFSLLSNHS